MNLYIGGISHKVLLYLPNSVAADKLTLLHSERPKLHRVLAFLSAIGLTSVVEHLRIFACFSTKNMLYDNRIASVEILQYTGTFKILLRNKLVIVWSL